MPDSKDGVIQFNVDPADPTIVTRSTRGPDQPGYQERGYLVAGEDGTVRFVSQTDLEGRQ